MRHHKQYNIREISSQDILAGGFSETLENLSAKITDVKNGLKVLREIKANPLHKTPLHKTRTKHPCGVSDLIIFCCSLLIDQANTFVCILIRRLRLSI
jgi:hypothetical protein